MSALGVLLALLLAQRTARVARVNAAQVWNLCALSLFTALVGQRLLLIAVNWRDLRLHPKWMLGLAMIHHPLLAGAGALAGLGAAAAYARWKRMPLAATADALAAPLALGLACEQMGALMAGSGYGTETAARWAVIYTDPLAARWSGTPLGIPLHPVQAYAALAFLTLSLLLVVGLPARKRAGDVAGLWLLGAGASLFMTELWRDTEGRGTLLNGAVDGPQVVAVLFVLTGAIVLMERGRRVEVLGFPLSRRKLQEAGSSAPLRSAQNDTGMGRFAQNDIEVESGELQETRAENEAQHG
jgi:phosphatidylglycerol---prolipoprotein diacylglyceryl transferase